MTSSLSRSAFWRGFREGLPFVLVIVPFGLLFGVVATEAGFNLAETMAMTVLVIAGASQFAAVQMMADNAPALVVVVTALAVNLRMAMYSAALTPHLGRAPVWQRALIAYTLVDQAYALAAQEYELRPRQSMGEKVAYFLGVSMVICPLWYGTTLIGATMGEAIPPGMALDFAVPITFLAMVAPMLRTLAHVVAALVSVLVALLLAWMPHNTGLLVAGLVAMAAGAQTELWQARRSAGL
ncbi:branched-chain amino acid ABC transporter permease [Frigidibacter albus]|uniref:Branched-chain amino acid ABC transporter permease n=1 Tax=Frigidibacter albus TaxID=1465486 RepID=A0A6L8VBZ2_9RHOB|nr:AzlC family ABC transporter permease [Frigidibacter albus]MZQ87838.1 branched-chain amino acid ABC transporter permease [Frigidibacter albus]NBE29744.1 branched-chain amino acid ABC transporter permease [Frigidibacter albus]GGH43011.1 branched-chain amino acid transporter AzlC [Frigidibacter albus]